MAKRTRKKLSTYPPKLPARKYEDQFGYYLLDDVKKMLSKKELREFGKWMYGQTCPLIKVGELEECAYYEEDVIRFIGLIRYNIPTYFD